MKHYITLFVIVIFIHDCCSSQFLRDLTANTVKPTGVASANCISTGATDKSVKFEGEVTGTFTEVAEAEAKDMNVKFKTSSGTAVGSNCALTTEGELTCTIKTAPTTVTTYTIELENDFTLKVDTSDNITEQLLKFKLENAVSFTTATAIIGVDATQTDKDKKVNYDEAKEEDLAFSVKFDADVTAETVPKVKANSKELTCTVDSTDAKIAKCKFTKEQLPTKDGKETKYDVTFVNACSTESATGITVTVSNSAFVTFKAALMFLGLFLL